MQPSLQEQSKEVSNAAAPKPPLAEELLRQALIEKNPPTPHDFPPETFLNPPQTGPNPEKNEGGFGLGAHYQEMVGNIMMEKVIRPKMINAGMSDTEIDDAVAAAILEYETPKSEELFQEGEQAIKEAGEENQQESARDKEQKISSLSHAIEFAGGWLSKHPLWSKAATSIVLASELASHAPDVEARHRGEVSLGEIAFGGAVAAMQNEAYGAQRAGMSAERNVYRVETGYRRAIARENMRYQRDIARLNRDTNNPEEQSRTYQQTHAVSLKAGQEEQKQKLEQLYRQFKTALNKGDTVKSREIRQKMEEEENRFVLEQQRSIERNTGITEGGQSDQRMAEIEERHKKASQNIEDWRDRQMESIGIQYEQRMEYMHGQTANIQLGTGIIMLHQTLFGSKHRR